MILGVHEAFSLLLGDVVDEKGGGGILCMEFSSGGELLELANQNRGNTAAGL